jgi:hypothetical protein
MSPNWVLKSLPLPRKSLNRPCIYRGDAVMYRVTAESFNFGA